MGGLLFGKEGERGMKGDKTLILYDGRVILSFDDAEHCYRASINNKDPIPAAGVTAIIKETLGLDQRIAHWMVKQAHDYTLDAITQYVQPSLSFDGDEEEYIRCPRSVFERICKAAKSAHRKTSKEATDIGSEAHNFAEKTLKQITVQMPVHPLAKNAAEAFIQWTSLSYLEPIAVERMIFSEKWWYAGTCDYFGKVNGKLCVLDLKTSKGFYREMPLQLAAYAVALEEETGKKIEDGWIVRLCKETGRCEPFYVELTQRLKDDWILVRGTHSAIGRMDKMVEEARDAKCG